VGLNDFNNNMYNNNNDVSQNGAFDASPILGEAFGKARNINPNYSRDQF